MLMFNGKRRPIMLQIQKIQWIMLFFCCIFVGCAKTSNIEKVLPRIPELDKAGIFYTWESFVDNPYIEFCVDQKKKFIAIHFYNCQEIGDYSAKQHYNFVENDALSNVLFHCKSMKTPVQLYLTEYTIDKEILNSLSSIPTIQSLFLYKCHVEKGDFSQLHVADNFYLNLSKCTSKLPWNEVIHSIKNLDALYLWATTLSESEMLEIFSPESVFVSLDIQAINLVPSIIERFTNLKRLENVKISNISLSQDNVTDLLNLSHLKTLQLIDCNIDESKMQGLEESQYHHLTYFLVSEGEKAVVLHEN